MPDWPLVRSLFYQHHSVWASLARLAIRAMSVGYGISMKRGLGRRFSRLERCPPPSPEEARGVRPRQAGWIAVLLIPAFWAAGNAPASAVPPWHDRVVNLSRDVCARGMEIPPAPGARLVWEGRYPEADAKAWQKIWAVNKEQIRVTQIVKPGHPTLLFVGYYFLVPTPRPLMRLVLNPKCQFLGGEAIEYQRGLSGDAVRMHFLGQNLKARSAPIPLNPVPNDALLKKRTCVRVALLDNGVNYLVPQVASRLAVDPDGHLAGYDFWDEDDRPFDFGVPEAERNPQASHFRPPQHGTSVASVFIADAPESLCVVPYRYSPFERDQDIALAVDRIAAEGARVIVLTTGRTRPWPEFRDAVKRHPEVLFILAAGNNKLDLQKMPIYPMAYVEPNILVVAASRADGSLWDLNNSGEGLVHVAVPAVGVSGLQFDGRPASLTGTSFAAPRAGALAGLIAQQHDAMTGAALREVILQRVRSMVGASAVPSLSEAQWQTLRKQAIAEGDALAKSQGAN